MGRAALLSFVCCCGFAVRIVWWSSVFALSSNVLTNVLMFMSLKYYGILVWYWVSSSQGHCSECLSVVLEKQFAM